jgi:hypothetical protein
MQSYEYQFDVEEKNESLKEDINIEKDDDQVIAKKVVLRLQDGKPLHDDKCRKAKDNMALFDGDIEKVMRTGEDSKYNSKALKNVIFLTIRNMVGLSTDNPPIPDVAPAKETPQSQKKAHILAASLEYDMLRTNFQDRLGMLLFDTWIKSDSFIHWFWNYELNDNDFEEVKLEDITFAPGSKSIQDSEYLVYHPFRNRQWWKKQYADFYDKIKFETVTKTGNVETSGRGSSARFISYWEGDIRIEQVMGKDGNWIVLKKSKNPYWEYRSTDEQIVTWAQQMFPEVAAIAGEVGMDDEQGISTLMSDPEINPEAQVGQLDEFTPIINFLSKPTKPFVQISSIKLLDDLYSKDLISQIKEIFIDMNMKKRQIADNLRGCNTKLIVDSNSFTEAQIASITDEPLQVLRADFQTNNKPVYFAETTNFPIDKIMVDMEDDARYIDDVFGHHEISRGAGNAGTLGQDKMNIESDRTPIRYQVRAVENSIVELWQGWIQLKKMFYTDAHYIKKLGATDGMEVLKLMSKDIEEGVEPILRPMSTAPLSKPAKAQQSLELYAAGALDPYTLYQDLGRNDPQALTNRLLNWINFGIISADDPAQVAADMQNHASTPGDSTENPIERADQENRAMQGGSEVPPTPPELVNREHVKLHMAFIKDQKNKMEEDAYINLENHSAVDKATLIELTKSGMLDEATAQARGGAQQEPAPQEQTQA